jgi:hypothetical protein
MFWYGGYHHISMPKKRTLSHVYRKIYEQHYGEIPKDDHGRSYEIHHIDGDHSNNDPSNLKAVTIQEHYDIHYACGDWAACMLISDRMKIDAREKSKLASLHNKRMILENRHPLSVREDGTSHASDRVENGTHHWIGKSNPVHKMIEDGRNVLCGGRIQRTENARRVENGTHHYLKRADGTSHSSDRVREGSHNFLGQKNPVHELVRTGKHHLLGGAAQKKSIENGTHPSQKKWECPKCGKNGTGSGPYNRWHGNNCKMNKM